MENFIFKSSNSIRGNTTKRWLHLLSFFMMSFIWQTGFSQTGTVQIGSGSVSSAADERIPVANYVYNYSQQIVTAAEYAAGGGVSGPITKIRYQTTSLGTLSVWNNWTVYIGNTNKTSFASSSDWVPVNQLTQVFSGTITPNPVNNQWFEIVFSQPFNYTGGNIVIAVDENTSGWSSAPNFLSYTSTSNSGIMYRNDSTNPNPSSPPTATYRVSILPQIQFEGTLASCLPPTGLSLSKTSLTSLDASWIGDAESYQIAINTSATPPVSGSGPLYGNTASAGNLITGETYYLHIRSICDGEFSGWATSSPLLLDYCVSYPTNSADTKITTLTLGNDVRPGVAGATTYTNRTAEAPLVIQQAVPTFFSLTAGSSTTDQYAAYSKVFIDLNKDGDFDDEGELIFQDSHATTPTTERTQTGTITIPVSETSLGNTRLRIVLRESGDSTTTVACGTYGYGETQDYTISITVAPSCLPPTTLTATAITTNTASLGWASAGSNFDIKWGVQGFNLENEGSLVSVQTNPYSLTELAPATAYQFYVRQNCGNDDLSPWAGPFNFVTACTVPDAPTAMTFTSVTTTGTTINYTAPANDPTGYTIFRSTSNIPPVLSNGTSYTVNQSTAVASLTSEGRTYFCIANPTTLSGSASSLTANTQYYYYVYSRNAQGNCTGFPWYSATALSGTMVTPSAAPTAFVSSNIAFTSATVGWTAPAAGGGAGIYTYSVEVATDSGFTNQITGSPFNTSTNSYNLTNLEQGTFYYVRIRTNNGFAYSPYLTGNITTLLPGQVGVGASTNSILPITSNYGYNYSQQIYTKAQVEANLEEGQNFITKIKFYYNGTGSSATPGTSPETTTFNNWTVYLGNTVKTSFSSNTDWITINNIQQSFSGTVTFPAPGNWMEIILDTPFQWDGESNIVVAVDENSTNYGTLVYWRSFTSASNTGIYYRSDSTNPDPASPPTASGRVAALAQIAFEAIETPDCLPISGVQITEITPYTAKVEWAGEDDFYILEYGLSGFTPGTGTLLEDTDNPTLLGNLLSETTYQVYVRQMCGSNESPWAGPYTFTTAIACPAPTALQTTMAYGTEATFSWTSTGTSFVVEWGPTGFTLGTGTMENVTGTTYALSNLTPETTYQLYVRQNCSSSNNGLSTFAGPISFTPSYAVTYSAGNIPTQFGLVNPPCQPEPTLTIVVPPGKQIASLTVQYSMTSQNVAWTEEQNSMIYSPTLAAGEPDIVQGTGGSGGTLNYSRTLPFAIGATGSIDFVIRAWRLWGSTTPNEGCNTYYAFIVNNSWKLIPTFEDIPSCVTPMGLNTSNITISSVNLSWNASTSETLEGYNWFIFEAGADPETDEPAASGTTTSTSVIATGLTSATTYEAYVQTDCGAENGESPLSTAITFTTNLSCGDMFYDNGGPNGNYTNGANVTQTFYPTEEDGAVYVTFSAFNTSGTGDNLSIYDGPDTSSPLIGTYSQTSIANGTRFVSSHPTGALTFVFVSDGFTNSSGWVATINCCTKGWMGSINTAWTNPNNWCGSIPSTTSDVIINPGSTNYPIISSNVTIGSLTVRNGASLTVNSNTLTVGAINVATGGTMTVKSGATLWQDANTVNTGNVTIQRNVTLQHLDYTVWSSPVVGQALQAFSPNTLPNRIRDYVANTWVAVPNVNANFAAGKGYMFRAPNVFDPEFYPNAYTWTGSFTGVPQTADEVVVPFTVASNHQSVGNPYPTAIDADLFYAENDPTFVNNTGTDILGAMYIWMTDRSNIAATGGDAWALYNPITGGTNPGGGTPHNGIIPAGQGFLLRTRKPIAELPSVKFTTDMRIAATGTFYRNASPERHRLWLNLANQETVLNQTLVAYVEGATQGFDASIDAEALSNNGTALYSLVDNNTNSFMIQGRALPFNDLDVVPMGFRAANAGTYTISLANFDGVFADGQDIFLVDALNQVTHNLKEANYTFVSEAGEFNSRFSVVYRQDALSVTNPDLNNNWVVYPKNGQFQIETLGFEMKQVIVYDMLGRTVYQSKAEGNNHLVDAINANQVLIVKVVTTDNVVLTKKVNN